MKLTLGLVKKMHWFESKVGMLLQDYPLVEKLPSSWPVDILHCMDLRCSIPKTGNYMALL
jgi:hypothetical protein